MARSSARDDQWSFATTKAPGSQPRADEPAPVTPREPDPAETPAPSSDAGPSPAGQDLEPTPRGEQLLAVLAAGGDIDLHLAHVRPRRVASIPTTYRIPLDLREVLEAWVAQAPKTRTATDVIVALLDAWARDSGLRGDKTTGEGSA